MPIAGSKSTSEGVDRLPAVILLPINHSLLKVAEDSLIIVCGEKSNLSFRYELPLSSTTLEFAISASRATRSITLTIAP